MVGSAMALEFKEVAQPMSPASEPSKAIHGCKVVVREGSAACAVVGLMMKEEESRVGGGLGMVAAAEKEDVVVVHM